MPTTRSSTTASRPAATISSHYNLRANRPAAGHFADMDDEPELTAADYAAANTLVAMRSAPQAQAPVAQRRSARIAARA
jgi:hypothetical protein